MSEAVTAPHLELCCDQGLASREHVMDCRTRDMAV